MDAHNCYPYFEWWGDRIDRALSAGTPLAIEQDLAWHTDPKSGRSWSVVTHGEPTYGNEPTMDQYFFERVRPIVEKALQQGDHGNWPLITLNLDFKDDKPEHLAAVLSLLRKYQSWLTTTVKGSAESDVQPLDVKPILVLTGEPDAQQTVFYDQLQTGDRVLLFGAIHTEDKEPSAAPEVMDPGSGLPTTGAGGTIRGTWSKPGASQTRGSGRRRKWTGFAHLWSEPIPTACGYASIRSTGQPRRSSVAMAGSMITTSARSIRLGCAGAPQSRPTSITLPRTSTSW
jgi:hypothetical protein